MVNGIFKPEFLDKMCLTNTDSCLSLDIYYYKNTFVAQEKVSSVWFWFNGFKLYIYGQSAGVCQEKEYSSVDVYTLSMVDGAVTMTSFPDECILTLQSIIEYYKKTYSSELKTIYLKTDNGIKNITNVLQTMIDNKIFLL